MCVASLTLIFTRSVGTLQPTRPNGLVGSKFNWPSEDQCQRSHSKWVFVFIPYLKSKYNQLMVSKLSRKSAICPRRSPWRLIVLVRSLRSARLDTAWLVKSVTYFNLIGWIGWCVREFQRSKYKFSSHPKTPGTHGVVWDNIFTNAFMNLENSFQCLIYTYITDHLPLIHLDLGAQESDSDRFITRRNSSMRNKHNFNSAISTLDWKCIHDETDMQNAFTTFHGVLLKLYNTHFPKQKVKYAYNTRKPWLSHGLREAIKKKK